uniref:Uncharacterized protein n=1 Tax=Oryza glumipatula TaxID=40148 RepID=A0A0E0B8U4_9ORYZ
MGSGPGLSVARLLSFSLSFVSPSSSTSGQAATRRCGSAGRGGYGAGAARRRPGKAWRNSGDPPSAAAARDGARASSAAGQRHGRSRLQGDRAVELGSFQIDGCARYGGFVLLSRWEGEPLGWSVHDDPAGGGTAAGAAQLRRCTSQIEGAGEFYATSGFSGREDLPWNGRTTKGEDAWCGADEAEVASGRRRSQVFDVCSSASSGYPASPMATAAARLFLHSLQPPAPAGEPHNGDL